MELSRIVKSENSGIEYELSLEQGKRGEWFIMVDGICVEYVKRAYPGARLWKIAGKREVYRNLENVMTACVEQLINS